MKYALMFFSFFIVFIALIILSCPKQQKQACDEILNSDVIQCVRPDGNICLAFVNGTVSCLNNVK